MIKLLAWKHMLQVFCIPACAVTLVWYGYQSIVLPDTELLSWTVFVIVLGIIAEILAQRVERLPTIMVAALIGTSIVLVLPVAVLTGNLDVHSRYDAFDHGGFVVVLFFVATLTVKGRILRAGYTLADYIDEAGNRSR